jgi:hypothetical protein
MQDRTDFGLIIGSTQKLACQYRDNSGWTQDYFGRMNRIGLDIGFTAGGVMAWGVIGSTGAVRPGVLTGRFVGASGEISVGAAPVRSASIDLVPVEDRCQ